MTFPSAVEGRTIKAAWFPAKTSLYQNEQCPVLLKLYVPKDIKIVNWGFPDAAKINCLAWRFSSPSNSRRSEVQLDNITHNVLTYSTTLSGINPGQATLGPAQLNVHQRLTVLDSTRGYITKDIPIKLTLPAVKFDILSLPHGAPENFNGAVGNFEIDAYCRKTEFLETEPTEVILRVAGIGNLPTIKAPSHSDGAWKIIDTSKITRGEERRSLTGIVTFRQLIRAEGGHDLPKEIPAYSFSYFDPIKAIYQTKTTQPIPVTILPAPSLLPKTQPAEELGTLPEEMRSIIGFIKTPKIDRVSQASIYSRFWYIIPATLCFLIVLPIIRRKITTARIQHPNTIQKNNALAKLSEDSDTRTFYRGAGHFIEQWLTTNPELDKILQERDSICFIPEEQEPSNLTRERKSEIITLLKRCSKLTLLLLLFITLTPSSFGKNENITRAKTAWQTGNYQEAIENYRTAYPEAANTPADILFNIGNCHHRLDQHGLAALAWRQALASQPSHKKARQNLRYAEIQANANVPEYEEWQYLLLYTPPRTYQILLYASLWTIGIIILIIIARRPQGFKLTCCIVLLAIAPILATLGQVGSHYYPDDHRFAPIELQAIVLENAKLHEEAHRSSDKTTLPVASLIKINATRGPWTNITTADESTGWIESNLLGNVR